VVGAAVATDDESMIEEAVTVDKGVELGTWLEIGTVVKVEVTTGGVEKVEK